MDVKKMYEEMPDEELKERAKNIGNYTEYSKKMILEVLQKRGYKEENMTTQKRVVNMMSDEELKEKMKDMKSKPREIQEMLLNEMKGRNIKKEKISEEEEIISKKTYSNSGNYMTRGLIIFLMCGLFFITSAVVEITIDFYKLSFFKKTKAIIKLAQRIDDGYTDENKGRKKYFYNIKYKYHVNEKEYIYFVKNNPRNSNDEQIYEYFLKNGKENLIIRYKPKNPNYSEMKTDMPLGVILASILLGLICIKIFLWSVKKASMEIGDFDIIKSKKDTIRIMIIVEVIVFFMVIYMYNNG